MALVSAALGQATAWRTGEAFEFRRPVELPAPAVPDAVVCVEFFVHGSVASDGSNVAVLSDQTPVPWRVQQVGPGDYVRVAFLPPPGERQFTVYYGGSAAGPAAPAWRETGQLELQTRAWQDCNLDDLEALQAAFNQAAPIGADYVAQVFQARNPFAPLPGPFLSRYRGTLFVTQRGEHKFFTSSQDCSFLLIDGQQVVAAPGRHGPVGDARIVGSVTLAAGPHTFEYWHAASGAAATMVAAWQPPESQAPAIIPPEAFGAAPVVRVAAGPAQDRDGQALPEFALVVLGDFPLAESDTPLVRVRLADASPKSLTARAQRLWDFGDGQHSPDEAPEHVYMQPGLYAVTLALKNGSRTHRLTQRIWVDRAPPAAADQPVDEIQDYLPLVSSYAAEKYDGAGLSQLVLAFEQADDLAGAARALQTALQRSQQTLDETVVWRLATRIAPAARDRLDDPQLAYDLWLLAAHRLSNDLWKTDCEVRAAQIAVADLLQADEAAALLSAAQDRLPYAPGEIAGRLQSALGALAARRGDRAAAEAAFRRAAQAKASQRTAAAQVAWRGAHSRTVEAFLKEDRLDDALAELRAWEDEFPGDVWEGYLPLLWARYWQARGRWPRVASVTDDLLAANPASPYADQLLAVAAETAEQAGELQLAEARYRRLAADYPGSPLVAAARAAAERLAAPSPSAEPAPAAEETADAPATPQ